MNEVIKHILERRSIRKYQPDQISDDELTVILEAGLYAPNAGSHQSAVFVVCQDKEINETLGRLNCSLMGKRSGNEMYGHKEQPSIADDPTIKSAFYGAPTVLHLFSGTHFNSIGDAWICAENILLAAHSIGVSSCIVARAIETFSTDDGQKILQNWQTKCSLSAELKPVCYVCLGYRAGDMPHAKPRKADRIIKV
ncbi:MAG: nitroreductase family protein [Treponema sp.]|jgi:nitroreductase|nr:nitroreductase family protein [Treponema sp.]